MKTAIYDFHGKEKAKIDLPKIFSAKIREDIVAKVLEAKKTKQPYAPSLAAGKQSSARGKIRHRRHVWQTHYGRGMSRIPRKVMSRRGTQFVWEGAEVPFAKGGMRAHPPKVISMINTLKVNKKEMKIAFSSAISATASKKFISKKYATLKEESVKAPIIIEGKLTSLKTKELNKILKEILGVMFNVAVKKKTQRAGKGKMRGRKYKKSAGLLIVTGEKENLKAKNFDVSNVQNLSVNDLASGGLGRIVIYTENAVKYLEKIK